MNRQAFSRGGFSVLELLVVIGIIALLAALALPAMQQAREAARRTECLNKLHQLGVALHSYHADHKLFPPGVVWAGPPGEPLGDGKYPVGVFDRVAMGLAPAGEPDRVHANWLVLMLPYLDQAPLYQQYNSNLSVADPVNAAVRTAELPVLKCPSDTFGGGRYVRDLLAGAETNFYARGCYALNLGPNRACFIELQKDCTDGFHVDGADLAKDNRVLYGSGLGGVNKSFSFKDVTAGQSAVVIVDEIRAGVHELDPRGAWALGFIGASMTARHGVTSDTEDAVGPNNQYFNSDDIVGCEKMEEVLGEEHLQKLRMPCYAPRGQQPEINSQATSRSEHPGGVHVLMVDGSAHFVGDTVNPEVWFLMHCRDADRPFQVPF